MSFTCLRMWYFLNFGPFLTVAVPVDASVDLMADAGMETTAVQYPW